MTRLLTFVTVALAASAAAPAAIHAQDPSRTRIELEQLMTQEERALTGVDHLTRAERSALEVWLGRYTAAVTAVGPRVVRRGAEITSTDAGGTFVILDDGTRWEIYLADRPSTVTWREGDFVLVRDRAAPIGEYAHLLINGEGRATATARFAGRPRAGDASR